MKRTLPGNPIKALAKRTSILLLLSIAFLANSANAQTVTTGKSYINITRPNGGTFLPGDTLEIRATIAINGGANSNGNRVMSIRYNDTINKAHFRYINNSLRMTSNEGRPMIPGLTVPAYTDGPDTDSAHIDTASGRLRFNIGQGAGACNVLTQGIAVTNAGALWGRVFPTFSNNCIRMYVYRVVIKDTPVVKVGDTIFMNAGNFRYRIGSSTTDVVSGFSRYNLRVAPDFGLCTNSIGTNAILGESGGTFGSGTAQNKAGGTTFVPAPYTFVNFSGSGPNDNFYGVANNTSANNSNSNTVPYFGGTNRVFGVWEIIGDHTGAVDPIAGNPPTSDGYALIINASYQTNRAFTQNVTNLCENTYYEFSAWFRNICKYCSCDSAGRTANSTGYVAGPGKDSAGVRPNLSFQIDGIEYYTSGNIPFTGTWVKKGFVFKTKPGQTSMTLTIRNNAPGGGGNDWAIDDIAFATCTPNMMYSPSLTPNICNNNALTIYDTVRSYFDNYTFFKWQKSTDGGTTWVDVSAPSSITPVWNATAGAWQYVSSYTVPPTETFPSNSGDKYRLITATSLLNLSNVNCRSTDNTNTVTLNVLICGPILKVDLTAFSGKIENNKGALKWTTSGEDEQIFFDVEKSTDGTNFTTIATINGRNTGGFNHYAFTDPNDLTGKTYYRIKMRSAAGGIVYSRILQLSGETKGFTFVSVINPFNNNLYFDLSSARAGLVKAELLDQFGTPVRKKTLDIREGSNQFTFENTSSLASGIYILKAEMNGTVIYRKVMKQNN